MTELNHSLKTIFKLANILLDWNYLNQELKKVDLIIVLGCHDLEVPKYAASLMNSGLAQNILVSGGVGRGTGHFEKSEAEVFKDILIKNGVLENKILIENKSTNTGENILFSYNLLKKINLLPKSIILIQKPYMLMRSLLTFLAQWPS